jgi:hypothetical protein
MMKRVSAVILVSALLSAGCHSHSQLASPSTLTTSRVLPVSSPTPEPGAAAERQAVLQRFTTGIWPAVEGYNAHPSQGGPEYNQYLTVIDKNLDTGNWDALRTAVHHLGVVGEADETQGGSERDGSGLRLADTRVAALNPPTAVLQVCYTFTALSYQGDQPVRTPTTSAAHFELHKADNWYLNAITNDQVVPNCSAAEA